MGITKDEMLGNMALMFVIGMLIGATCSNLFVSRAAVVGQSSEERTELVEVTSHD